MPTVRSIAFTLGIIGIGLGTFGIAGAIACSPARGYVAPTVQTRAEKAEVVLEVSVIRPLDEYPRRGTAAIFEVHRWYKGIGPDAVMISGFGSSSACQTEMPRSARAIVFARLNRDSGTLMVFQAGLHDGTTSPSSGDAISAHLEKAPRPPRPGPILTD